MRREIEGLAGLFLLLFTPFAAAQNAREININEASRQELEALGILTPFQIASIEEYRKKNGDLFSSAELCTVDGFDEDDIEQIEHYVRFDPSVSDGKSSSLFSTRIKNNYLQKGFTITSKYLVNSPEYNAGLVIDNDPMEKFPDFTSAFFQNRGLTIGDFKACFGQGMTLWKGMAVNSLGEPSADLRRESAIQGYKSSDESSYMRGIAFSKENNSGSYSMFVTKDLVAGGNYSICSGTTKFGLTAIRDDSGFYGGADIYGSLGNLRYFAELATNSKFAPAMLSGVIWNPSYNLEMSGTAKVCAPAYVNPNAISQSKDIISCSYAIQYIDGGWKFNGNILYKYKPTKSSGTLKYRISAQYSFKNGSSVYYHFRNSQHRFNTRLYIGKWVFGARFEGNGNGYGCFTEAGWKGSRFEAYARVTHFNAPSWNDRIYLYERDVPQSYSTLAYYGKGTGEYLLIKYSPVKNIDFWIKIQQDYEAFFIRIFMPG